MIRFIFCALMGRAKSLFLTWNSYLENEIVAGRHAAHKIAFNHPLQVPTRFRNLRALELVKYILVFNVGQFQPSRLVTSFSRVYYEPRSRSLCIGTRAPQTPEAAFVIYIQRHMELGLLMKSKSLDSGCMERDIKTRDYL